MQMPGFRYGDKTYEYSVRLLGTRKKTISIHVHPDSSVEVKAPAHISYEKIAEVMTRRARWVVRHVERIRQQRRIILPREYISGETYFYLGRRHMLKINEAASDQVRLMRGCFMVACRDARPEHVKALLDDWYKTHARKVFERRLTLAVADIEWLKDMPPLSVRRMKKQWGSCSSHGRISLNWHLVKAPVECIDYVIIHELCHLREHNHSKRFYALLDRHFPDWRPVKARLDEMADLLLNE
jgi:hypothetical protein